MKLCENKSVCGKKNPSIARYCSYCGTPFKSMALWSNQGGNIHRTSHYSCFETSVYERSATPHGFYPNSLKGLPYAQTIIANDYIWVWGDDIKNVHRLPLLQDETQTNNSGGNINRGLGIGVKRPDFSCSPAFDGIGIGFLYDGIFSRLSAFDGNLMGDQIENAEFKNTAVCAPVVAEFKDRNNPFQPYRYWITCLKNQLLVVDVRCINEEDFHLIPLNLDPDDQPRSPVIIGENLYVVTKNGWVLGIKIKSEFQQDIRKLTAPEFRKKLDGFQCMAPMAINDYLVFETLKVDDQSSSAKKFGDYKEIGYCAYNPEIDALHHYPSDDFTKEYYLDSMGHLPGLSDGDFAYFQSKTRQHCNKFVPGQAPRKIKLSWNEHRLPAISSLNTIILDNAILAVDTDKKRVVKWKLDKGITPDITPIPMKGGTINERLTLISQPAVHGDILVLTFQNQIVRMSL